MIKSKRKMLREYYANPDPDIKRKINEYNKMVHKMLIQYKSHFWLQTCQEIEESKRRLFYQKIKKLSKYKSKLNIPEIEENGQIFNTDDDKANIFANYYEQQFAETQKPTFDQNNYEVVNSWYQDYFNTNVPTNLIEIEEEEYFLFCTNKKYIARS